MTDWHALARECMPQDWDTGLWKDFYEERAAIREHDGLMTRTEAEVGAFEDTIDFWLVKNQVVPVNKTHCLYCELPLDMDGLDVLPEFKLHLKCHSSWQIQRELFARQALAPILRMLY